jgi:hypothetical protein
MADVRMQACYRSRGNIRILLQQVIQYLDEQFVV